MQTVNQILSINELATCTCCSPRSTPDMGRRRALQIWGAAIGSVALATWTPQSIAAKKYDAMLVNCIDPRLTTEHFNAMATLGGIDRRSMPDNYSHFVIAGGALGAVHPAFSKWHETFWENLAISIELHRISRVVGLTHRDCGAARLALGEYAMANRDTETHSHSEWLKVFANEARSRHAALQIITGIIDFDGSIETVIN